MNSQISASSIVHSSYARTLPRRSRKSPLFLIATASAAATALSLLTGCGGGGGGGSTTIPTVTVPVETSGTRGTIPLTVQIGTTTATTTAVTSTGESFSVSAQGTVKVSVPAGYADRQFVGWAQGGTTLSTSNSYTFTPQSLPSPGAPITAMYQPRSIPSGGFTPNFSLPDYKHWASFPLRVYLDPTITASASTQQAILAGFSEWTNASGGLLSYDVVTDPAQANVKVTLGSTGELTSGASGVTNDDYYPDNSLMSADISLDLQQSSPQIIQTIAAHEFGHALGLYGSEAGAGHSSDPNDTMNPVPSAFNQNITEDDINTVADIYPNLFNGS